MRLAAVLAYGGVLWLGILVRPGLARDLLFWNMTEHEMSGVYLAKPASNAWGSNMALSDTSDRTV